MKVLQKIYIVGKYQLISLGKRHSSTLRNFLKNVTTKNVFFNKRLRIFSFISCFRCMSHFVSLQSLNTVYTFLYGLGQLSVTSKHMLRQAVAILEDTTKKEFIRHD